MTVISRNPVHSVLWLILAFLSSAGLFVLLGAEFLAMLLIIVYVGAVAVLFLFVVMMLDVDFSTLKAEMASYLPLALLIGVVVLIMQLSVAFGVWTYADTALLIFVQLVLLLLSPILSLPGRGNCPILRQ